MTKAQTAERDQAITQLREWIKPGDTVYTVLDAVSRSGMSRQIRVLVPLIRTEVEYAPGHWLEDQDGNLEHAKDCAQRFIGAAECTCSVTNGGERRQFIDFIHPNWAVGKALGLRHARRHGREGDALVMGGAGMDMGYHLIYSLARTLWPAGFGCIGQGCPSNDHSNGDRDRTPHQHQDGGYALRARWL